MKYLTASLSLFATVLFLSMSDKVQPNIPEILSNVGRVVLFTLFPANVLFRLIANSPLSESFCRFFSKFRIWKSIRLSDVYISAVVAGQLSGFPTGACIIKDTRSTKNREKALALSSLVSPAFLIALFGTKYGFWLWINLILTLWSVCIFFPSECEKGIRHIPSINFPTALNEGIYSALTVSGSIIFFSTLLSLLPDTIPKAVCEILYALTEMGSALRFCQNPVSISLALSFGGFSTLCQISYFAENVNTRLYLISRIPLFFTTLFFFVFSEIRIFQTLFLLFFLMWQIERVNACKKTKSEV